MAGTGTPAPHKTTKAPTRQMWRRSIITLVIIIGFCFTAVVGKMGVLMIAEGEDWQQRAVSQRMSDSITTPSRGTIYDANMNILAASSEVWKIILSPKDMKSVKVKKTPTEYYSFEELRGVVADGVSEILGIDRDKLYEQTGKTDSQYEVVQSRVEYKPKEALSKWVAEHGIGGFAYLKDYKRYYPLEHTLSNVLGFVGTDNVGLEGLEAQYDSVLTGKAGRIITARNGWGDEMPTTLEYKKEVDAEDGKSLVLTIDQYIQTYAEKYLEEAVANASATNRGAVIIQDVNTGAILAMATKGDYDPNQPFTVSDPTVAAQIAALAGDEQSKALTLARQKQWQNKPIVDFYEPGSVFKTFTSCMAFEEGIATEANKFTCTGSISVVGYGRRIYCHQHGGHGTIDFPHAIYGSCNPYFVDVGLKIGGHNFFKYFTGFGFTQKTGIDMMGEQTPSTMLYHSEEKLSNPLSQSYLATSSFGQTFKVSPIQMITAMSAVANGGKLMQPYVVQKILDGDGNVVENITPTVKRQVISEETAKRVAAMLDTAVNTGSKNAYVAGYRVAGKTGTSEKRDIKVEAGQQQEVIGSFAGFAPADDPQIAILLMVDQPQGSMLSRYGSSVAAPYAQKILAEVMPYMSIEPKYTEKEVAAMNRTTPGVENTDVTAARAKLTTAGLNSEVLGSGATVVKQVPEKGKPIPKEGKVYLYTDDSVTGQTTKVPDFTGKSVTQAKQAAAQARLNIQLTGGGLDSSEAKASGQNVEAGASVPPGTVVNVTFIVQNDIR